jgi:hypothetical protein
MSSNQASNNTNSKLNNKQRKASAKAAKLQVVESTETPVEEVVVSTAAVQEVAQSVPVQEVAQSAPVVEVTQSVPVQEVAQSVPVVEVTQSVQPLTRVWSSVAKAASDVVQPVTSQRVASQAVTSQAVAPQPVAPLPVVTKLVSSTPKPTVQPINASKAEVKKPAFSKSTFTNNSNQYKQELKKAEDAFFHELTFITKEIANKIEQSSHMTNWQGLVNKVDFSKDFPEVTVGDKKVTFSRRKFAENRYFVKSVINFWMEQFPKSWITVRPSTREGEEDFLVVYGRPLQKRT